MVKKLLQSAAEIAFFMKINKNVGLCQKLEPLTSTCPINFALTPSVHGHATTSEMRGQFQVKLLAKQRGHMVYRLAWCYRFLWIPPSLGRWGVSHRVTLRSGWVP